MRRLYRDLIQARRAWPELLDRQHTRVQSFVTQTHPQHEEGLLVLQRGEDPSVMIIANLSPRAEPIPVSIPEAFSLRLSTEQRNYGGTRDLTSQVQSMEPFELLIFGTPL